MQLSSLRNIGLGCLALLLTTAIGLWAAKDLPRRAVAAVLSERLEARVRVDRFEILATDRFLLAGLSITDLTDIPFIETLRLEELVVEGSLGGLLDRRYERLWLRGLEARLAPAPAAEPRDRPLPVIGELVLEPATIRIAAGPGSDDLLLCVTAVFRDVGTVDGQGRPPPYGFGTGEARLSAPVLDLQPLVALTGTPAPAIVARVEDLEAELSFDAGGAELGARASSARLEPSAGARPASNGPFELAEPRFSAVHTGPVTEMRLAGSRAAIIIDGQRLRVDQPSAEATVTASASGELHLELTPTLPWLAGGRLEADWDPAAERWRSIEARLRGLDLERLLPGAGLEATAGARLRAAGERLDYRLEILPRRLALAGDRLLTGIEGATVEVTGSLPFEPSELRVPDWGDPLAGGPLAASIEIPAGRGRWGSLSLPPAVFPLAASFDGRWLGGETQTLAGHGELVSPAGRLTADGDLDVHVLAPASGTAGRAYGTDADLAWAWTGIDLEQLLRLARLTGQPVPTIELAGKGEARGSLRGPIAGGGPEVEGRLALGRLEAAPGDAPQDGFRWRGGESTARFRWAGGRAPVELSRLKASGTLEAPGVVPLALDLEASGRFDPDLAKGRLAATIRESPASDATAAPAGLGIARAGGSWRLRPGQQPEVSATLDLEGLDLGRWQRVAEPLAGAGPLAGFELRGVGSAELEASLSETAWRLAGPVRLESAGFVSADGSRVVEGLASRWQVAVHGAPGQPIEAEGSGSLGGFLLLWNTFFGDFTDVEAALEARARIEVEHRPWRLEVESSLPGGPIVEATLDGGGDAWNYALSLDDTDLAGTHRRYLGPLLEEPLGRLELGGKLAARLRGHLRPGEPAGAPTVWSVIGGVELQDLELVSGGGQATVAGLDLDLPLDLRRRPTGQLELSGPRLGGRLAFERLAVRGLELPPTESDLWVEADSVGLEKAIALEVLGGGLTLERLTLRELLRPSRHLESGIALAGIRLERISDELGLLPLEGELSGRLTGVRLSPSLLAVDGGGELEVFGGTVAVHGISGEDVLSRFPKLEFSADFRDLDLGALTRRIDFGEMTGVLQGKIEKLELFRGVPVRFSAHLETVEREGVPRTVDVKAVNNITILGTGQRAGVLDRGIQRFFNRYTYERLAVDMRLDRDVLLLRGLENRGGKELFLRGRLPFRIDVVNAQPGRTVSFQAMVGRLKSLDFARARTER